MRIKSNTVLLKKYYCHKRHPIPPSSLFPLLKLIFYIASLWLFSLLFINILHLAFSLNACCCCRKSTQSMQKFHEKSWTFCQIKNAASTSIYILHPQLKTWETYQTEQTVTRCPLNSMFSTGRTQGNFDKGNRALAQTLKQLLLEDWDKECMHFILSPLWY